MQLLEVLNGSVFPMNYLGLVQTWCFSHVPNLMQIQKHLLFLLICIRFGACEMRRLNCALQVYVDVNILMKLIGYRLSDINIQYLADHEGHSLYWESTTRGVLFVSFRYNEGEQRDFTCSSIKVSGKLVFWGVGADLTGVFQNV